MIKAHYENPWNPGKQSLKNSFLRSPLPISRNLPFFKPLLVSAVISLPSELFPKLVPIWRLFLRRNTCVQWAGLTPTNNESAGKKKSVRVSKAGCYIKPLLVQCANAVVKSNKHPEIRNRYLRIKKRRGHKKAIIAIARMLLTALYHILKNGENYNAELYRKSDLPPVDREITVEQALMIARNQGYKIKSATA